MTNTSLLQQKKKQPFYGWFYIIVSRLYRIQIRDQRSRQVKVYTSLHSQAEWYNTAKYSHWHHSFTYIFLILFKCLISDICHAYPAAYSLLPTQQTQTFFSQDELWVNTLSVLLRATIIEEQFPHRVTFLIVSRRQIQNKALNPLKQCSTLACWPPQVIQSRRLKKIVLSPRDYSLEDEWSMLSSCEDSISGSVTKMKTLIKTWYHIEKRKKKKKTI